jgi:hypothetical protein
VGQAGHRVPRLLDDAADFRHELPGLPQPSCLEVGDHHPSRVVEIALLGRQAVPLEELLRRLVGRQRGRRRVAPHAQPEVEVSRHVLGVGHAGRDARVVPGLGERAPGELRRGVHGVDRIVEDARVVRELRAMGSEHRGGGELARQVLGQPSPGQAEKGEGVIRRGLDVLGIGLVELRHGLVESEVPLLLRAALVVLEEERGRVDETARARRGLLGAAGAVHGVGGEAQLLGARRAPDRPAVGEGDAAVGHRDRGIERERLLEGPARPLVFEAVEEEEAALDEGAGVLGSFGGRRGDSEQDEEEPCRGGPSSDRVHDSSPLAGCYFSGVKLPANRDSGPTRR